MHFHFEKYVWREDIDSPKATCLRDQTLTFGLEGTDTTSGLQILPQRRILALSMVLRCWVLVALIQGYGRRV